MFTKSTFILFFCWQGSLLLAQHAIKGVLIDSISKEPVEFANIGIIGKGVGTVCNEKGEFNLVVPDSLINQKIRISRIGFKTKELSLNALEKQPVLSLSQSAMSLNEVAVSAKKLKIKIVGSETQTKRVSAGFAKNNLGAELAIKINIKHPNTQLRKFFINIVHNSIGTPLFRFNVYNVSKDGKPSENILTQNILFEPKSQTGLVELDLAPYNIYVNEDVFIALEWVKDLGDVKGLSFSTRLVGGPTYYRQASQDKWEKLPSFGVGLHAEIGY